MAETGLSLVVTKEMLEKLQRADHLITNLATKSEQAEKRIIASFKRMGDDGVGYFIKKLNDAQQRLSQLSASPISFNVSSQNIQPLIDAMNRLQQTSSRTNITINGIDVIGNQSNNAIDAINRLMNTLTRLQNMGGMQSFNQVNVIGRQTLKEMNREAKKMEKTLEKLEEATQKYGISANDLAEKLRQAREAQRQFNETAKQQAQSDVQGLLSMKGEQKTLNELKNYANELKRTMANLDPQSKDWQDLNRVLIETNKKIKDIEKSMQGVKKGTNGLMREMQRFRAIVGTVFSVSRIVGFVAKLASVRKEFELQQRSLQALLQNKDEADKLWQKTIDLAVKSPFKVKELVTYTKQLAAYRIENDKLYETNKMLADISAGLGVDMQRLILAYGQVKAANYLRGTELRQFSEAGVNILGELAEYFSELEGRAISVGDVFEMVSKRMVSFSDVEEVFKRLTSTGGTFYRMQEIQSETLKGMLSNLGDSIDLMLNEIGNAHDSKIKGAVGSVKNLVDGWRDVAFSLKFVMSILTPFLATSLLIKVANGKFAASLVDIAFQSDKVATKLTNANAWIIKFGKSIGMTTTMATGFAKALGGLATLGVAGILAGIAIGLTKLITKLTSASREAKRLKEELDGIYNEDDTNLQVQIRGYENLIARLKDVNRGSAEHKELIDAINSRYGEYIGYIVDEKTTYDQLKTSIESVNLALTRKAKLSTFEKALAKVYESTNKAIMDTEKSFIYVANNVLEKIIDGETLSLQIDDDEIDKVFNVIDNKIKNLGRSLSLLEIKDAISEALGFSVEYSNLHSNAALVDIIYKRSKAILTRKEKELEIDKQINRIYKDNANSASEAQKAFEKLAKDEQDALKAASNKPRWEQEDIKRQFAEQRIDLQVKFEGLDASVAEARKKAIRELDATINDINRQIEDSTTKLGEKYANLIYITPDQAATGLSSIAESTVGSYKAQQEIIKQQNGLKEAGTKYDAQILENAKKTAAAYYYKLQIMGRLDLLQKETNKEESKELQTLNRQISALKEAKQTFDNLRKTFSDEEAATRTASAFEQLFKDVGIDDITIGMTFDESGIMKVLKDIPNKAGEAGRIAKEKFNAELSGALDIEGKENLDKPLLNSIQDMFTRYEVSLELQKLNIPPDLAERIFDVDTITLPELKTNILELRPQFKGQDMLKEWDRIVQQLDQLEAKQQEENAKRFVKFLSKSLDETKVILEQKGVDVAFAKKLFDEGKISAEQFGEVVKNITTQVNSDISKINLDKFKESPEYIQAMGNMYAYSAQEVRKLIDSLQGVVAANAHLFSADEAEAYQKAIQNAQEALDDKERSFFRWEDFAKVGEILKTEKELEKAKKDRIALQEQEKKQEEELVALQQKLQQLELSRAILKTKGLDTTNIDTQISSTQDAIGVAQQLVLSTQNSAKTTSLVIDKLGAKMQGLVGKTGSAVAIIDAIIHGINDTVQGVNEIYGEIGSVMESFGKETDFSTTFGKGAMIMDTFAKSSQAATQGWEALKQGDIAGVVVNVIKSVTEIIKGINAFKDAKLEVGIQDKIEEVEKLEKAYDDLAKSIEKAYSISSFEKANDDAMKNLRDRIDATEKMIQLEEDKKATDEERIDEWKDEVKSMRDSLRELEEDRIESLGGFGSGDAYKDAAEEFVSSWMQAYKEAGDGLSGLNEQFDTFFENMLVKQLMMRGVDKFLQPFYDQFDDMFKESGLGGGLATKEELDNIKNMWANVSPQLNDFLSGLMESLGVAQDLSSGELSGLQRGIQGITEDQADILASYLNSIRFFVADNNTKLSTFIDSFTSSETPNPILSELRSQSDILRTIRDMFSSVIGIGESPTHSGSYIKVAM